MHGEWEKDAAALEKEFASLGYWSMFTVKMIRGMTSAFPAPSCFKPFMARTETRQIKIGGSHFHDQAVEQTCYVHTEKPEEGVASQGKRKCLIYFHGGGCCTNTAEDYKPLAS
jgi:acetyl esterase/lipase